MKTTKEMISVMTAYEEGKVIEFEDKFSDKWRQASFPSWDWARYDYRVKEEPKYRPYKDTEELINDFCERSGAKRSTMGEPFIWIRPKENKISKHLITDICIDGVYLSSYYISLETLFKNYTYLDGSPCGCVTVKDC